MAGTLYVVGTPIGNLGDMTTRQKETLETVDFIAAEDTRVSVKLLNHLGLKKPMISYHEHNRRERGPQIVERLLAGENAAIVTDAGMPCVSDPGEDLVRLCIEAEIPVTAVPGPTAAVTALCLSGLPTNQFRFEGFLPTDKKVRWERLSVLRGDPCTLLFYEAPHRLKATLSELLEHLGDRRICLARELTKLHEELLRMSLSKAVEHYQETAPRGEYVLVVEGASETEPAITLEQAVAHAKALAAEGVKPSEAAKEAALTGPFKKGDIYRKLMEQKEK